MINLRYHIVSIAAVFLALGIGILMGTTVIEEGVVKTLRADITREENRSNDLEAKNDGLRRQISLWGGLGEEVVPMLTRGSLTGRSVVFVVPPGADSDTIGDAEEALTGAGGQNGGRIDLTGKWSLPDQAARERLALAAGPDDPKTAADPEDLIRLAAERLGARLHRPAEIGDDLLSALTEAGFVKLSGARGAFPPRGSVIVVVGWGGETAAPPPDVFFVPFLESLATRRRAAVIEPLDAAVSLVDRVRRNRDLAAVVATVDHADTVPGGLAFVFALRDLADRRADHFGVRRGASGVAPNLS